MRRKIAAILAADVVGYSRLVAEDENRALEHLLACREIFAEFVERGGGRIFNTAGDAVLAEFPSAVEALLAGIDIQDCLRTHYDAQADGFRMQFRMGMTIGDVVERDGDLLGDGVNVAARLEGLAEPGGICISGIMHEQVMNKVSARFRDVGMKTVKNIPAPIHVYALDGAVVSKRIELWTTKTQRWSALLAVSIVATIAVGATIGLGFRPTRKADAAAIPAARVATEPPRPSTSKADAAAIPVARVATEPSRPGIYGVTRPATKVGLPASPRPYDSTQTPFVGDGERIKIGTYITMHGPNSALALSRSGAFGLVMDRPSVEAAREEALKLCGTSNRGECLIYEVNGEVVWPRPIPLPARPWIDGAVVRTPFDAKRLLGLSEDQRRHLTDYYPNILDAKALALGPSNGWNSRSERADEQEAVRAALEACGDQQGVACRVVAVGDRFVVADSTGPVDAAADAVERCGDGVRRSRADGAGEWSSGSDGLVTTCLLALVARPSDAGLRSLLDGAVERGGRTSAAVVEIYRRAAATGDAVSIDALGMAYELGALGLMRDPGTAFGYYRSAAEDGNTDAMRNLARAYATGIGVMPDIKQAAQLSARADREELASTQKPR